MHLTIRISRFAPVALALSLAFDLDQGNPSSLSLSEITLAHQHSGAVTLSADSTSDGDSVLLAVTFLAAPPGCAPPLTSPPS